MRTKIQKRREMKTLIKVLIIALRENQSDSEGGGEVSLDTKVE